MEINWQTTSNDLPVMHCYDLPVRGDVRKNISKRTAVMELKWGKVAVIKPSGCKDKQLPTSKELYVVEAKEQKKTGGIYWRMLTSHAVTNVEEAMQIIEWYKQRWYIEQVHRLLKTEGFRIEGSQLEQGWAIRKLTLLAMMATLRILQMMLAYEDDNEQPIDEVFDKEQQQCLQMINGQQEGATEKLKNPSKSNTLKWATWIIARLGGWKGYTSQRKPGQLFCKKALLNSIICMKAGSCIKNSQKMCPHRSPLERILVRYYHKFCYFTPLNFYESYSFYCLCSYYCCADCYF